MSTPLTDNSDPIKILNRLESLLGGDSTASSEVTTLDIVATSGRDGS
ncbi:MAG: hypothetical protein R3C11_00750 [Planctomycetaceae bacterium]